MIDFYVLVGSMACVVPRICGFLVFRSFVEKCVLLALAIDFCGSIYTIGPTGLVGAMCPSV